MHTALLLLSPDHMALLRWLALLAWCILIFWAHPLLFVCRPRVCPLFVRCEESISDHHTCSSWYTAKSQAPRAQEYKSTRTFTTLGRCFLFAVSKSPSILKTCALLNFPTGCMSSLPNSSAYGQLWEEKRLACTNACQPLCKLLSSLSVPTQAFRQGLVSCICHGHEGIMIGVSANCGWSL